jgi:glutamate--cysteine ligase
VLDAAQGGSRHGPALQAARSAFDDSRRLPSARMLDTMAREFGGAYIAFILSQSAAAKRHLVAAPWPADAEARFSALTATSIAAQAEIQAADRMSFDDFLQHYLSPARLQPSAA